METWKTQRYVKTQARKMQKDIDKRTSKKQKYVSTWTRKMKTHKGTLVRHIASNIETQDT